MKCNFQKKKNFKFKSTKTLTHTRSQSDVGHSAWLNFRFNIPRECLRIIRITKAVVSHSARRENLFFRLSGRRHMGRDAFLPPAEVGGHLEGSRGHRAMIHARPRGWSFGEATRRGRQPSGRQRQLLGVLWSRICMIWCLVVEAREEVRQVQEAFEWNCVRLTFLIVLDFWIFWVVYIEDFSFVFWRLFSKTSIE